MYSHGTPHMTGQKQDDQLEHTYTQQLCEDTGCSSEDLPKAMNDREKRGSGISVLAARHDDDVVNFTSHSILRECEGKSSFVPFIKDSRNSFSENPSVNGGSLTTFCDRLNVSDA